MRFKLIKESIEVHNTLNPKLWDNNELKSEIREKIKDIVKQYIQESEILTPEDIIDIELLGSNASFNYTKDSDLDIHLVVNMEQLTCDPTLMQLACNSERSLFNKSYDIKIKGIDAELYVEDVRAGTASNGIYSIKNDKWIKFPTQIDIPDVSNNQEYINLLDEWKTNAQQVLTSTNPQEVKDYINELYNLRRLSIMTDGEYAIGNLVFKEIRNLSLLQQLKDRLLELTSKELSLESLNK